MVSSKPSLDHLRSRTRNSMNGGGFLESHQPAPPKESSSVEVRVATQKPGERPQAEALGCKERPFGSLYSLAVNESP